MIGAMRHGSLVAALVGVFLIGAAASADESAPAIEHAAPEDKSAHGGRGRHFHDPKQWTKSWDAPSRKKWQRPDEVVALLDVAPGENVADLGTGTGYFLSYLAKRVGAKGRVIALDVEQAMVDHVEKRVKRDNLANVEVRKVPFNSPDLRDGEVDRILIVNTWHHVQKRSAYAALLHKALDSCDRPGAVLIVEYTRESPRGPSQKIRLDPETVMKELRSGGFQAVLLTEKLPYQYAVKGERRDRPATCPPKL